MEQVVMTNGEALETILDLLPVKPNAAQIAAGRTMAKLCDGEPNAAMLTAYQLWLDRIESVVPDEPDELDLA